MRLLVIEDEPTLREQLRASLQSDGFVVDHSGTGVEGQFFGEEYPIDLAIVDIGLPDISGIDVIKAWRESGVSFPVLILTARDRWEDKVAGLEIGADDYLVKPYALAELIARIEAQVRRQSLAEEQRYVDCAGLQLDLLHRSVEREGESIELQPREYALLEYLVRHQERIVTRRMIMENVWNYNFDPETNVVEARMCRLRDKIDKPYPKKLIKTVRGVGYILSAQEDA